MRLFCFLAAVFLGAETAHSEPALWVVKGPHATVYLFGSVHALQKDKPWRSPKIDAAIQKSTSLWLELIDDDDMKAMQAIVMELGIDAQHPLSSLLSKEQVAKLDKVATSAGIPGGEAGLEPMRPWMAAVALSAVPMMQAGFDPNSGVEKVLKPEFKAAGKQLHGFETMDKQMHMLADMPQKNQLEFLKSSVDEYAEAVPKFKELVDAWYAGDDKTLDRLVSNELRDKYPELYKTLILKRNDGFAKQVNELLKGDGVSFVAVGAGHLVGSAGVPAMLEKMGFKVERQ